ncbi:alpha-E domain-containing protein [Anianabacter salinae]|uniref:alpha-E domain-containing protein n=1 Tax=Anianabacter salinae TaxID=2851023 RepID=UPI00225E367C|nr:alpha-E domain-containing protein [Anianabacter salinae]MBV0914090.1 alpha-E domain-containing protein [Anianabacter salinae]
MLSRTADNLFWIARYLERAETSARLLEVGARNALLPNTGGGFRNEWESILNAAGTRTAFVAKYGDMVQRNVESHMFFDRENTSSIASCLHAARENARIVRTAMTTQVWDAINVAHQEMAEMARTERSQLPLRDLTDWTMRTTALIRGAVEGTLLRNDGYHFIRLGSLIERADSTARILDVKYFVLLPGLSYVGSGLDNYQWQTVLRALSSARAFNWVYKGELSSAKIADFLILNRQCPRSIRYSVEGIREELDALGRGYGTTTEAQSYARALQGELSEATIADIFDEGLHEFLTRMIRQVGVLSGHVYANYMTGRAA